MLKFSVSSLNDFQSCALKYWFNNVSGLPRRYFKSDATDRGSLFHAGIAAALKQRDPNENIRVAKEAVLKEAKVLKATDKEVETANSYLEYYLPKLGINETKFAYVHNGKPLVEFDFEAEFDFGVLRGYVDAVLVTSDGSIILVDWKTRKTIYDEETIDLDKQLYIYAKMLELLGVVKIEYALQYQISGVPQYPRFVKGGDTNTSDAINKNIAKTNRTMFNEFIAHMSETERRKALIAFKDKIMPDESFEIATFIRMEMLDYVWDTTVRQMEQMATMADTDFLPVLNSYICKGCVWKDACLQRLFTLSEAKKSNDAQRVNDLIDTHSSLQDSYKGRKRIE